MEVTPAKKTHSGLARIVCFCAGGNGVVYPSTRAQGRPYPAREASISRRSRHLQEHVVKRFFIYSHSLGDGAGCLKTIVGSACRSRM